MKGNKKEQESVRRKVEDTQASMKDFSDSGEEKTLGQRIESLVEGLEKNHKLNKEVHSIRFVFGRGVLQGLGFVIGSTIFAGSLYYFFVTYLGFEFLKEWTLDYVSSRDTQVRQ